MAITITSADIKRKCMISTSDTTYDSSISSLIAEMQPALEYTIDPVTLSNTTDTRLQAALKLGILEIMAGEFLQQLEREFGSMEAITVAGVNIGEMKAKGSLLVQQGTARLVPFLKTVTTAADESAVSSTTSGTDRVFSLDDTEWQP